MKVATKNLKNKIKDLERQYMKEIKQILRLIKDKNTREQIMLYISELNIETHIELEILKTILLAIAAWKGKNINTYYLLQMIYWNVEKRDYWGQVINTLKEIVEQRQTEMVQEIQKKTEEEKQKEEEKSKEIKEISSFANSVWRELGYTESMPSSFMFALRDKIANYEQKENVLLVAKIFKKMKPNQAWGLFIHELPILLRISETIKDDNFRLKNNTVCYIWKALTHREEYTDWDNILKVKQMPYRFIKTKIMMLATQDASKLPNLNVFLKSIYSEWSAMEEQKQLDWRKESKKILMEDVRKYKITVPANNGKS